MKSVFIVSFLRRYWKLLIAFVLLVLAGREDRITYFVGPLFFLIELGVGSIVVTLFLKHIAFPRTIDVFTEETHEGASPFVSAWNALPDAEKVKYTLCILMVLFLGVSWIAASIAK